MNAKVIGTGQGRGHGSKWLSEFESSIAELIPFNKEMAAF